MACNVQIPVDDIAEEVKQLLNLDQYVKQDNGTANNLTLKGGVTLDSATKQDLCEALSDCFDDKHVSEFRLNGSDLEISLTDGTKKTVDLSVFNTPDKFVTDFAIDDTQSHIVLTLNSGEKHRISKEELAAFLKPELQGLDGKSAYELWLKAGNTGSEQDFLDSLKGAKGAKGDAGPQGPKGADGAVGPQGPKGADGAVGPQGPKGADGAVGPAGPQGPAGEGADLDLSNLPLTTWKDGTSVLVRQDNELKRLVPQEALFQEIGVGMAADRLSDFTGKEFDVVVTVTNSGRNTNTETDLVITKPSNTGYTLSDFRPTASGATIERVDDLNYKVKNLQSGGTGVVRFKVRLNEVGTYQFGASVNPNTLLDMQENNNTASLTLSARAATANPDDVGLDCPLITASYKGETVPVFVHSNYDNSLSVNSAPAAVVKGSLSNTVINIPQATTVVVAELSRPSASNDTELLQDGGKLYATTYHFDDRIPVQPTDNTIRTSNLVSGVDYTFSSGVLTIKKDTGVRPVVVSSRGAGKNCKWQTLVVSPSYEMSSGLTLSTTHPNARKSNTVEGENLSPQSNVLDALVPLDGLQHTGRGYRKHVGAVSSLPKLTESLTITLTAGEATTFTVTAGGELADKYFANASSAGNIQVRGEGNTLHVTVLNTVNPADAMQVKNVKFVVV